MIILDEDDFLGLLVYNATEDAYMYIDKDGNVGWTKDAAQAVIVDDYPDSVLDYFEERYSGATLDKVAEYVCDENTHLKGAYNDGK